ncbi:putative amidoligase family protein [Vibrio phage 275E43-1]|nr:putative amidoligase family protein [Vibrio phage 275E43-1]
MSLQNRSIGDILGKNTPAILEDVGDWRFTSNVGVEVEVENFNWNAPQDLTHWQFTSDSSLRNNGAELISRILSGRNVYRAVHDLSEYFKEHQENAEFSERTSLHVHLDITDLTLPQLKNFVYLCLGIEPLLMSCVSDSRINNNFCLEIKHANAVTERLSSLFHSTNGDDVSHRLSCITPSGYKYAATNFANMGRLGTVEFRMHHGTADKQEILTWISVLSAVKRMALNYESVEAIRSAKVNQDLAVLFCEMLADIPTFSLDLQEVIEILEDSFEYANDLNKQSSGVSTRMLDAFRIQPEESEEPAPAHMPEPATLQQRLNRLRQSYNSIGA